MPLKNKRRRYCKSAHEYGQTNTLNAPKSKAIALRSTQRRKQVWDDVSEWMKFSRDFL